VIAGLLLLFRRTTTLGALLVVAIMTNIFMLNVSYDVPVKIGSAHILLLALVLLAPDLRRLLNFFVLNRETQPVDLAPNLSNVTLHRLGLALKAIFIASALLYLSIDTYSTYQQHIAQREKLPVPPDGWYNMTSVKRDGQAVPALSPDELRWKP
jgi:hypothetical protein